MATLRPIQDQNLDILYTGAPKKADKKASLAGRKALNDISNSRKPSVLPNPLKKGVISIEEDPVTVKAKLPKETGKGKVGGRKALTDVTNSVMPPSKQGVNTCRKFEEEGFLHNHQECIKAQAKALDLDMEYFLKSVGLHKDKDVPMQPTFASKVPLSSKKPQLESSKEDLQMEEMMLSDDEEVLLCRSPACPSPQSSWGPCVDWDDDELFDLMVIGT